MDDVQKLGIEINAILKELGSMRQLAEDLKRIKENAGLADEKVAQFQQRVEKMRNLRESFQSLNLVGAQMMAMGGGVLFAFKKMAGGFIEAATEAEQYELTLTTLFRSAERAKEELDWAKKFEDVTPYALKDIIEATVMFRSFGLDAKKYLGMAGDMAAVMGKPLASAVYGVAKAMKSGAGAMEILQQSFGITGDALRELGWKGKGDLEGFRKALEKYLVTMYKGGMKAKAETIPAYIEGLRSYLWKFREMIGAPIIDVIKPDLAKLYEDIRKLWDTGEVEKWAKVVRDLFLGIYDAIKKTIVQVIKFTKPIFELLQKRPELAKIAGQVLLIGSALTFAGGGALVLTGMAGQAIVSIISLTGHLSALGLPLGGTLGLLGKIGLLGAAAFAGWKIGEAIRDATGLDNWLQNILDKLLGISKAVGDIETGEIWKKELKEYRNLLSILEKEGLSDRFIRDWKKTMSGLAPETAEEARKLLEMRIKTSQRMIGKGVPSAPSVPAAGLTPEEIKNYKNQLEFIKNIRENLEKEGGYTTKFAARLKRDWGRAFGDFPVPESQKALVEFLSAHEKFVKEHLYPAIKQPELLKPPKLPKPPAPDELGLTTPYNITADTRPEFHNYYYTIHYERDSIQIHALELTPEKLARVLDELNRRHSLAPVTP